MSVLKGWCTALGLEVMAAVNTLGELVMAGYQSATNLLRVAEVNPISAHHEEWTPAAVTNGADTTHYYYADMDGFAGLDWRAALSDGSGTVTLTLEGTKQDDGTAPASCAYDDITADYLPKASFTGADSPIRFEDDAKAMGGFKYIRWKIVANTGATDGAWTIYAKVRNL